MAFVHGKKTAVFYNGSNLSRFFNEASISRDIETAETTAFGDDDKNYITGLGDGTMSLSGMFDGQEDAVDDVLSGVIGSATPDVATVAPEGPVAGKRSMSGKVHQTSYEVSSPVGDVVAANLEVQVTDGVDVGVLLAGNLSVGASGDTTAIDNGAATANGAVAYLHVTENDHDDATVIKVQDSSDNISFADLITFTSVAASAVDGQQVVVSGAIDQYVRAEHTPGGSSGSVTYTLAFARK
jgi:hypothetical protein